jgi:hypothetical protein
MRLETVQIKGQDGPVNINKEDFDPKKHELFNAPAKRGPKPKDSK